MRRGAEDGFSLVMLMAAITIMLIGMAAAVPSWQYVMKDDREQELLFRGWAIADAVGRYQAKNGNALPTSLDVLVKGHYLRKAYKDPMMKDGQWHFLKQGEGVAVPGGPGGPGRPGGGPGAPSPSPSPTPAPSGPTMGSGGSIGGFIGVASRSKEKSLRLYNNAKTYDTWIFLPLPAPRVVGKAPTTGAPGVLNPSGSPPPVASPTPLPPPPPT